MGASTLREQDEKAADAIRARSSTHLHGRERMRCGSTSSLLPAFAALRRTIHGSSATGSRRQEAFRTESRENLVVQRVLQEAPFCRASCTRPSRPATVTACGCCLAAYRTDRAMTCAAVSEGNAPLGLTRRRSPHGGPTGARSAPLNTPGRSLTLTWSSPAESRNPWRSRPRRRRRHTAGRYLPGTPSIDRGDSV